MSTTGAGTTPNGGAITQRETFGAIEATQTRETSTAALAARQQAEVNARYVMAERHGRKILDFRKRLLEECERPTFAERVEYSLPRGYEEDEYGNKKQDANGKWIRKFIKGPSIRFVEVALRLFANVYPRAATVFESDDLRIVEVSVTDLESNITYSAEVQVAKSVERRGFKKRGSDHVEPPAGRQIIGQRVNSDGDTVYIVAATDEELLAKQNALISKTLRTLALRILPGDIVDEAVKRARKTLSDEDAKDPQAAKLKLIDDFGALDILPSELEEFLGHPLDRISPAELKTLRSVYVAVASGETSWQRIMTDENPQGTAEEAAKIAKEKAAKLRAEAAKQGAEPPISQEQQQEATAANAEFSLDPDDHSKRKPIGGSRK